MKRLLVALILVGCGDDGSPGTPVDAPPTIDAPAADAPLPAFVVTSTAYAEGDVIPTVHTCNGTNTSPALTWANPPSGALSYAVVLTDKSNGFVHWVIYDIPPTATGLPASVENTPDPANVPGARQTVSIRAGTVGYFGPCPPAPPAHAYELAVYPLNVATLPGASKDTTRDEAALLIQGRKLGTATLTGMYTTPPK